MDLPDGAGDALNEVMPSDPGVEPDGEPAQRSDEVVFVDAATRVSNPSAFDEWYYGIEDRLGQGTVGMAVCLIVFIIVLVLAIMFNPI